MSRSALHNDIGTLLARANRIDEAIRRYTLAIDVGTSDLAGLQGALRTKSPLAPTVSTCPNVMEAEGLAWFHQQLLLGDLSTSPSSRHLPDPLQSGAGSLRQCSESFRSMSLGTNAMQSLKFARSLKEQADSRSNGSPLEPRISSSHSWKLNPSGQHCQPDIRRTYSHSSTLFHPSTTKPITPLDNIVHDIHQHSKLDCPEKVYSCNGLTPLGLEYICDPLPVLRSALRNLVYPLLSQDKYDLILLNTGGTCALPEDNNRGLMAAWLMDSAGLISSRINVASLKYRTATELEDVRIILSVALEDCHSVRLMIESMGICGWMSENKLTDVYGMLEVVGLVNMGTVLFRMDKVRDSLTSFESAKVILERSARFLSDDEQNIIQSDNEHGEYHPHDDNRFPSHEYLLLAVRTSIARVLLRLNELDNAEEICKETISKELKTTARNSLRCSRQKFRGLGCTHSNSVSETTSAVSIATAAYHHDLDRRFKWLSSVASSYLVGLLHEARGEADDLKIAMNHYNRLLSLARVKLDHRHPYICTLLERRGAVLFEQRKLQCSILSNLACLKILEYQKATGSPAFDEADLARILYAVARVLHDKEEYHDALRMYQRALLSQRAIAAKSGKPSLDVITTLCNICRVHHLSGEIDAALSSNKEVLEIATLLVGGKMDHPFLIHRLKVEGNILIEVGRLQDAMNTFVDAARRCCEDGQNRMIVTLMGSGGGGGNDSQEDADAGDSSVLSIRSAASLAHICLLHPAAAAG